MIKYSEKSGSPFRKQMHFSLFNMSALDNNYSYKGFKIMLAYMRNVMISK